MTETRNVAAVRARGGHGRRFLVPFWIVAGAGAAAWSWLTVAGWRAVLTIFVVIGGTCGGILPPFGEGDTARAGSGAVVYEENFEVTSYACCGNLIVLNCCTEFPAGTYDVHYAFGGSDTASPQRWLQLYVIGGGAAYYAARVACGVPGYCSGMIPSQTFVSGDWANIAGGDAAAATGARYAGYIMLTEPGELVQSFEGDALDLVTWVQGAFVIALFMGVLFGTFGVVARRW